MATLKEIQQAELEMLQYVDKLCSENDLHYIMLGGTLLGAVRHHGFIPWDDDIDIYMTVRELKKLRKVFHSEQYFLQNPETEREALFIMDKVRKNGSKMQEPGMEILNIHQGIWVDIFSYTDAAQTEFLKKCQLFLMRALHSFRCKYYNARKKSRAFYRFLTKLPYGLQLAIDRFLLDLICFLGSKNSKEYLIMDVGTKFFFEKSVIQQRKQFDFEGCRFWGIENYDKYLTQVYGADYMTPKRWSHLEDYSNVIIGNEGTE